MSATPTTMLVNGRQADVAGLQAALINYGHFTSMQVRDAAVQGFDLHLDRLQSATLDLFGTTLDVAPIRAALRAIVATWPQRSCSIRVTVFSREFDFRRPARAVATDVLVAASAPAEVDRVALRVQSQRFERSLAHVKHVGTFPLFHAARRAAEAGFDDALFVDGGGRVSEGSVWNVAFCDGHDIVWPEAPALRGTCERLLQDALALVGMPQCIRPVALQELAGFRAAVATNSRGVRAITAVDTTEFPGSEALRRRLADLLAAQPWQPI